MKLKNVLLTLGLALGTGAGIGAGIAAQSLLSIEATETSAYAEKYYLVGSFASGYSNYAGLGSWNNAPDDDEWAVAYGGASKIYNFVQYESDTNHGDIFKFVAYNNWDDAFGRDKVAGTAAGHFGNDNGNIYCNRTGAYSVSISGDTLYIDYAPETALHFTGLDGVWDDGDSIVIDGSSVSKNLTADQKFRFKATDTWDNTIGWNELRGNCYGSFADAGDADHNIYISISGKYSISISTENHGLVIDIVIDEDSNTIYVLDLNGNLIASDPHCYLGNTTTGATTGWPGSAMAAIADAPNVFEYSYPAIFDLLVFNDGKSENAGQTMNLDPTGKNGMCLVLDWGTNSDWRWNSNCWVSLDAAKFIANYMKFDVAHENAGDGTGLCTTNGWYEDARDAYKELTPALKADVCSSTLVVERLAAWAVANHETFALTDGGVGAFSASRTVNMFAMNEVTNNDSLIAIVAITALAAAAGMFFVFRRKEQ